MAMLTKQLLINPTEYMSKSTSTVDANSNNRAGKVSNSLANANQNSLAVKEMGVRTGKPAPLNKSNNSNFNKSSTFNPNEMKIESADAKFNKIDNQVDDSELVTRL